MKKILIPSDIREKVVRSSSTHYATNIFPISIKENSRESFNILFFVENTKLERFYLAVTMISEDTNDRMFVVDHPKNICNIVKNKEALDNYRHYVTGLSNDNLYNADFEIIEEDGSFVLYGYKAITINSSDKIKFTLPYDLYIKLGLFFTNTIKTKNVATELLFLEPRLMSLEPVKITDIKYKSSAMYIKGCILSNYIATDDNKNTYQFNHCSVYIGSIDRILKNSIGIDQFLTLYNKMQVIDYIFYDHKRKVVNIIYRKYNIITQKAENDIVLEIPESICDETNFLNLENIYEKKEKENN